MSNETVPEKNSFPLFLILSVIKFLFIYSFFINFYLFNIPADLLTSSSEGDTALLNMQHQFQWE